MGPNISQRHQGAFREPVVSATNTFPFIPSDLLGKLETLYPDQCPLLTESERGIWFKAGQRDVVNFLRRKKQEQNEQDPLPLNL